MKQIANQDEAECFAIEALSFFANDGDILSLFLRHTGLTVENLRQIAHDKSFFIGVVNFLQAHEKLLIEFCQKTGYDPSSIHQVELFLDQKATERFWSQ